MNANTAVSLLQVMILYFHPSVFRCVLLRWVRLLGFAIMYGTIILKLYRYCRLRRTALESKGWWSSSEWDTTFPVWFIPSPWIIPVSNVECRSEEKKFKKRQTSSPPHLISSLLVPLLSSSPSLFLSPFLYSRLLLFSFPLGRFLFSCQPPASVLSSFPLHPLLSPSFSPSVFSFCLLFLTSLSASILVSSLLLIFPVCVLLFFPSPFLPSHLLVSSPLFPSPFLSSQLPPTAFLTSSSPSLLSQVPSSPLLILTCPASWPFSVSIIQLPLSLHTYEDTHTHTHTHTRTCGPAGKHIWISHQVGSFLPVEVSIQTHTHSHFLLFSSERVLPRWEKGVKGWPQCSHGKITN